MIYVSLTTIPERIKNIEKSINSIISQTLKPDKIFLNIPYKYERFNKVISDEEIPKFDKIVEVTRCDDFGPGTKLMGSLTKLKPDSLIILADDDHIYQNYMIEKFFHYYTLNPNNAYSFYVHPLLDFGIGQGADGFAINTNNLSGIGKFYDSVVKKNKEIFLYDDLWYSFFLRYIKKNKILSLQQQLKIDSLGRRELIYKQHTSIDGLISMYGSNLKEAVKKRDEIALQSLKYMKEKIRELNF